ncbi:hypothetical protein IAU60_005874 [Kwoniella sp. DSM 27419]
MVSTPPRPSPSKRPSDLPTFSRSPSVTEAIQQYESRSRGSSPSGERASGIPRPKADPSPCSGSDTRRVSKPLPRSNSESAGFGAGPSRIPISPRALVKAAGLRTGPTLRRRSSREDLFKVAESSRAASSVDVPRTLYYGEFGERETKATAVALEADHRQVVRTGFNLGARSSGTETEDGVEPSKPRVLVPMRTSSRKTSPSSPVSATMPPPISPRTTSARLSRALSGRTDTEGMLADPLQVPSFTRSISQSSLANTIDPGTESTDSSTYPSPNLDGSPRSKQSPRKSPNLTIQTRPPMHARVASASSLAPSPPVPAKSPLRNLSRENSEGQARRASTPGETLAQAATVSLGRQLDKLTPLEPPTEVVDSPDDIRFTTYTLGSVYSQDSPVADWGEAPSMERRKSRLDSRSSSLPRVDKALPGVPETPISATATSSAATQGHTPISPPDRAKSPLPVIRVERGSVSQGPTRSSTEPLRPLLPTSPSIILSKRSHLLNEIATSERSYAKDLALVRDAYMYRFLQRPSSSTGLDGDASRRSSMYTSVDTKRSSGYDSSAWTSMSKSSSDGFTLGHFQNGSSSSSFTTSQPTRPKSMAPPVGKPLSPSDVKAVFLNLDLLAGAADDLASAFEQAMEQGSIAREADQGGDRLGRVFVEMVSRGDEPADVQLPRLRPLYNFYCARQSQASARLVELQADPAHAAHLDDCWASIKPQTHAWNLDSMLIKPVQRITKYPLLFDDLLASTTPVHPDYFAIRTAATMSRAIATEIDEAKRRKDVVSSVIKIASPKEAAPSKLLGFKRFRKPKSPSVDLTPLALPESSLNTLKDLVIKVDELDHCVRRVGKEIIMWTAAAKEVILAQDGLVKTWLRVVQLEPSDPTNRKLLEFRKVVDQMMGVWQGLLLESTANPKKVIAKRDAKYMDYSRYHALRASKRATEKSLVASAAEFVALHTQLVDELPAFIEGCMRILDLALVAFARAQARFHQGIKHKLEAYDGEWLNPLDQPSVVKAWHEAWAPYAEAMDHFQNRVATFNAKQGSRPTSRSGSPMAPPLRHSASITAPSSRPTTPQTRFRSASLRSSTTPAIVTHSPSQSRFSLLRRNSRSSAKADDSPKNSGLRPSSVHSDASSRLSWGLPKISPGQTTFEGIGLSPSRSTSQIYSTVDLNSSQVSLESTASSKVGLGLGNIAEDRRVSLTERHPYAREVDAAEGWRNEPVLYQCACVADFIFHEVGRIDELPSFPYPEVGVDNDGVLVGRAEDGGIGLVICSFLEPLRD